MFKLAFSPGIINADLIKQTPERVFPAAGQAVSYWFGGSQAIYQGVRRLGLGKGDTILVPAYSCGSEIASLLATGMSMRYYRSLPDLSPDFDHLERLCRKNPSAIFIIHYFGFPQPMKALLDFKKRHNLLLVEDNAHGLYSADKCGNPLGNTGDIAVFSFTKSLPTPDGGALVINHAKPMKSKKIGIAPRPAAIAKKAAGKAACQFTKNLSKTNPRAARLIQERILDRFSSEPKMGAAGEHPWDAPGIAGNYLAFDPVRANWRMSLFSHFIMKRQAHQRICNTRRRNFSLLLKYCTNANGRLRPLFPSLPEGVCPLLFPVQSCDSLSLYRFLRSRGVEALRFWRFFHPDHPGERFPFETTLKKSVIALPIHQDIRAGDVLFMGGLLREWECMHRKRGR